MERPGPKQCRIYENAELRGFAAREIRHGLLERFDYNERLKCGRIQDVNYVEDIAKLHPSDYLLVSHNLPNEQSIIKRFKCLSRNILSVLRQLWFDRP